MPRLTVWLIRTALGYLATGFTFGALLLANKGVLIDPLIWKLLPAHIEAVLIGWTLQLVLGVAFWILPRQVSGPPRGNERLVWAAYCLLNLGVVTAMAGQVWDWPGIWLVTSRCAELGAVVLFVSQAWPRVKALGV